MNDSPEPVTAQKKSKLKKGSISKAITVLVLTGALVGVGFVTHNFVSKYNNTQAFVSYGGFAETPKSYDPHLVKFISESDEVLEKIDSKTEIVAVFEQPHLSGEVLVNKITPEMKAKYVFKSKIYFNSAENVDAAKSDYISYYKSKGYVQEVNEEKENSVVVLSREFNPKEEKSEAIGEENNSTKAEDKLIISIENTDEIHNLSIMVAQTPLIPLSALPVLDGNKNIAEIDKAWNDAKANKQDGCKLTPNSTFGGWRSAYGCVDSEDIL
jgi:hypothetical protein